MQTRTAFLIAGVLGFLAVVAGTFGAHALDKDIDPVLRNAFEVGVRYHMYHTLAILACAGLIERLGHCGAKAILCWTLGTVTFSGSLYALAITDQRWLDMVAPIGGLLLLIGWAMLIMAGWKMKAVR